MFPEKIEESFHLHLEAIQLLQTALESSYLDAYVEHESSEAFSFSGSKLFLIRDSHGGPSFIFGSSSPLIL